MKKTRKKGLVSIVVTNYNNEKYILDCLDSLINQTYKNIEIIIIDDASTDNSVKVINDWINTEVIGFNKKSKVFLHCLKRNIGFSGAATLGLYLTNGEFIAIHDGDDYSHPNRIEKQVEYLKNSEDIKAVGTDYYVFSQENPIPHYEPNFIKLNPEAIRKEYYSGNTAVSYGTLLFYGELFDSVGGLTRKVDGAEDYEFITKLLYYGIDNLPDKLYYYRRHDKQRSKKFYSVKTPANTTNKTLSVLFVLDKFNIGGTETHVLNLAKDLIKKEIRVTILGSQGPLSSEFEKLNCKIYNIDFPVSVPKNKATRELFNTSITKIINDEEINIIHAHQSPSGSLAVTAGKSLNIPCVFTVHGMYYDDIVDYELKLCNSVISVSYPVFQWLLKHDIQSKVIPNGITYNEYGNAKKTAVMNLRHSYNIPDSSIIAMYCSRMAWGKIKTCENLIRVCKDLNMRDNIDIQALIVGDGPGYKYLTEAGKRANDFTKKQIIHFTGTQVDLNKYYMASDCVVGTGRVAIEGMASKKTIIATGNNGYCGIVTKNNFEDSWQMYFGDHNSRVQNDGIYLYDDLKNFCININSYKSSVNKIYDMSKDMFDISIVADNILNLYKDLVK